jgi:hypothetical protein
MPANKSLARARRLIALANNLLAIAREIEAENSPLHMNDASYDTGRQVTDLPELGELSRTVYLERRRRNRVFEDHELFGEPAWDILLDLFTAAKERKRVSVTSACIAADVPTSTALRWLTVLEQKGLVIRESDSSDARRIFVRLSAEGYAKMVGFFAEAATRIDVTEPA